MVLIVIIVFNLLVRVYGRFEYTFRCNKIAFICLPVFVHITINARNADSKTRLKFTQPQGVADI